MFGEEVMKVYCDHCEKELHDVNDPTAKYWCVDCVREDRELIRAVTPLFRRHFTDEYINVYPYSHIFCGWDIVLNSIPKKKKKNCIRRLKCLKGK